MNSKSLHELVVIVKNDKGVPVVTSLEVADKFGKRHDHVLRDIDNLLEDAPNERPNFGVLSYVAKNKAKARCFEMTENGFMLLAMGFTGKDALKWKIAFRDAFNMMRQELTRRQEPANMTRLEILTMALEAEKKVIALERKVEVMQPDVDAINMFRATPGSVSLQIAAKELKQKPVAFCDWLHSIGWLHWRANPKGRRRVAYQPVIDRGWLCHGPAALVEHGDGRRERVSAVHVTAEGMIKLAELLKTEKGKQKMLSCLVDDNGYRHDDDSDIINEIRHDDAVYGHGDD